MQTISVTSGQEASQWIAEKAAEWLSEQVANGVWSEAADAFKEFNPYELAESLSEDWPSDVSVDDWESAFRIIEMISEERE